VRAARVCVLERVNEQGESAKTADRTELQRLLQFCRTHKGQVHFVVVFNLTRCAREKYDHFALRALKSLDISLRPGGHPGLRRARFTARRGTVGAGVARTATGSSAIVFSGRDCVRRKSVCSSRGNRPCLQLVPAGRTLENKIGGPDRDRTGDLLNAIQARSQLRYRPNELSAKHTMVTRGPRRTWSPATPPVSCRRCGAAPRCLNAAPAARGEATVAF
jgi:hypothetical protein